MQRRGVSPGRGFNRGVFAESFAVRVNSDAASESWTLPLNSMYAARPNMRAGAMTNTRLIQVIATGTS